MSIWDNVGDFVDAVVEGDAEGAADAAGAIGEDVSDGINDAGEAVSEASGGAVDFGVDEDGLSGSVDADIGVAALEGSVGLDLDGSDGDAGAYVAGEASAGGGSLAQGRLQAEVDTDSSDGSAGVTAGGYATVAGVGAGAEVDAGTESVGVRTDLHTSGGTGVTGSSSIGVDGAEFDAGVFLQSDDSGERDGIVRDEAGVTVGVGGSGQIGVDAGVYWEHTEKFDTERSEVGVTVNADASPGQLGVDAGTYIETSRDDKPGLRIEDGLTVNVDASPGQVGIDAGGFLEMSRDGEEEVRMEAGVTVNVDASPGQVGIDAGGYGEASIDGEQDVRSEAGVTVNVDGSPGQVGLDGGVFLETSTDDKPGLRIEDGLTVNVDASPGQVGIDAGGFLEMSRDGGEEVRMEAGVTANVDASPTQVGFETGVFAEASIEGEEDVRYEAGFAADVDTTPGQVSGGVGTYAEESGPDGETGRLDLSVRSFTVPNPGSGSGVGLEGSSEVEQGLETGDPASIDATSDSQAMAVDLADVARFPAAGRDPSSLDESSKQDRLGQDTADLDTSGSTMIGSAGDEAGDLRSAGPIGSDASNVGSLEPAADEPLDGTTGAMEGGPVPTVSDVEAADPVGQIPHEDELTRAEPLTERPGAPGATTDSLSAPRASAGEGLIESPKTDAGDDRTGGITNDATPSGLDDLKVSDPGSGPVGREAAGADSEPTPVPYPAADGGGSDLGGSGPTVGDDAGTPGGIASDRTVDLVTPDRPDSGDPRRDMAEPGGGGRFGTGAPDSTVPGVKVGLDSPHDDPRDLDLDPIDESTAGVDGTEADPQLDHEAMVQDLGPDAVVEQMDVEDVPYPKDDGDIDFGD